MNQTIENKECVIFSRLHAEFSVQKIQRTLDVSGFRLQRMLMQVKPGNLIRLPRRDEQDVDATKSNAGS